MTKLSKQRRQLLRTNTYRVRKYSQNEIATTCRTGFPVVCACPENVRRRTTSTGSGPGARACVSLGHGFEGARHSAAAPGPDRSLHPGGGGDRVRSAGGQRRLLPGDRPPDPARGPRPPHRRAAGGGRPRQPPGPGRPRPGDDLPLSRGRGRLRPAAGAVPGPRPDRRGRRHRPLRPPVGAGARQAAAAAVVGKPVGRRPRPRRRHGAFRRPLAVVPLAPFPAPLADRPACGGHDPGLLPGLRGLGRLRPAPAGRAAAAPRRPGRSSSRGRRTWPNSAAPSTTCSSASPA